jgi:hypothetical protein
LREPSARFSVCPTKNAPKEFPPMTLSESALSEPALSELLEALRTGDPSRRRPEVRLGGTAQRQTGWLTPQVACGRGRASTGVLWRLRWA